jgi:hypothetical protein
MKERASKHSTSSAMQRVLKSVGKKQRNANAGTANVVM